LSWQSFSSGGLGIGSVLTDPAGKVLGRGRNQRFGAARLQDPSRDCSDMPRSMHLPSLYGVKSWAARLSRWRRSMDNSDP
jgi:hypothetical protein